MKSPREAGPRHLRIFDMARTTHFERLPEMTAADFLFRRRGYDFDPPADLGGIGQLNRRQTVAHLWRTPLDKVELNEPAALNTWPSTLAYVATLRLKRLSKREGVQLVYYAIENADPSTQVSGRLRLPRPVARRLARLAYAFLLPEGSRIAFGTDQARDRYLETWPGLPSRCELAVFPGIAAACRQCVLGTDEPSVVFLGDLDRRKGLLLLTQAWAHVTRAEPAATLHVLGKGVLEPELTRWAADRPEVSVTIDPSRDVIHTVLSRATCLTLVSLRDHYWREQIGLPILEGLSHGCEIVASDETGIASWLASHHHHVVEVGGDGDLVVERVAASISRAISSPRTAADITSALPPVDGRITADRWMFGVAT